MQITSLVENTSKIGLPVEHGLSLYITMDDGLRILFDMGQGRLFAENAERIKLPIEDIDIAIVSHGHYDHGGGLKVFLELNSKAKVYIHQMAFEPHYSLRESGLRFIGLDSDIMTNKRVILCDDLHDLGHGMTLFADVNDKCGKPAGNRLLYGPLRTLHDSFDHEQNLIIQERNEIYLFAGCAHNGIANILNKAIEITGKTPSKVFAGMHLVKSGLSEYEENAFIAELADRLLKFDDCKYYTMHCTGIEQYYKLKDLMGDRISYLACGDKV